MDANIGPVSGTGCGDRDRYRFDQMVRATLAAMASNVLGTDLQSCSLDPLTGFYRDGCCNTGGDDVGVHVVCAEMTERFLSFSVSRGNDLVTPVPAYGFPGLKPGDRWCVCASRWKEAFDAGVAPPVHLEATHMGALEYATLDELKAHLSLIHI